MRLRVDRRRFRRERERFALRFCCEDCAYFLPQVERCAHGWPADEHRQGRYLEVDRDESIEVVYCKEFELA